MDVVFQLLHNVVHELELDEVLVYQFFHKLDMVLLLILHDVLFQHYDVLVDVQYH